MTNLPVVFVWGLKAAPLLLGAWLGLCAEIVCGAAILWWRLERRGWLGAARVARARLGAERAAELLRAAS